MRQAYRQRIKQAGALARYARPGNLYNSTLAEADWSTPESELLPYGGTSARPEGVRLKVAYSLNTYFTSGLDSIFALARPS